MAVEIINPASDQEFDIGTQFTFKGTADSPITKVELWADDRWLLGTASVRDGEWSLSYAFNAGGTRLIIAKGFDVGNGLVDTDNIWLFLEPSSAIDLNMRLTPNFTLGELTFSTISELRGLDNTPTPGEIARLRTLCQQILQPARDALGALSINSGFRSREVNEAVGGVPNSAHRLGYAADIVPTNGDTRALAEWVVRNREFDQVILEFGTLQRPRWIHLSVDPRNRREVLRATRQNGTTVYTAITIT